MSKYKLSNLTGIEVYHITCIEKRRVMPRGDTLERIYNALGERYLGDGRGLSTLGTIKKQDYIERWNKLSEHKKSILFPPIFYR